MLHDSPFEQWCQQLALSSQARDLVAHIRSSPPSRLVQSRASNVSGRYPSAKMQCSIQFESRRGELALIYQLEHDPAVLAYYDQPGVIKLMYQSKKDRRVGVLHTPDFFVLYSDEAGWIESKMEDRLMRLAIDQPHRYIQNADGSWSCPPGEAYAKPLGFFYRVHSSAQIDWVYQRNLRFLEDYLRGPAPLVPEAVTTSLRTMVMSLPGISLLDLLHASHGGTADDIYVLIITDQLYVDLSQVPLTDPAQVQVFLDRQIAEAYAHMHPPPDLQLPRPFALSIAEGTQLCWDGKPWTILNVGDTAVTLLSEDKRVKPIPHAVFEMLLQQGMVTGIPSQIESDRQGDLHARLERASPKHLEVATERYRALGTQALVKSERQVSLRTLQRWKAKFRQAEAAYDNGYVGLLASVGQQWQSLPTTLGRSRKAAGAVHHWALRTTSAAAQKGGLSAPGTRSRATTHSCSQLHDLSSAYQATLALRANTQTGGTTRSRRRGSLVLGIGSDNSCAWREAVGCSASGSYSARY